MRTKVATLQRLKAGPDDGLSEREFKAYASTWTRTPDSYGDVVAKGAFADTIKEWQASGNVVPVLYGHDASDPTKNIAATKSLVEDDHGLLVHGVFDETPMAEQVYQLVKGREAERAQLRLRHPRPSADQAPGRRRSERAAPGQALRSVPRPGRGVSGYFGARGEVPAQHPPRPRTPAPPGTSQLHGGRMISGS